MVLALATVTFCNTPLAICMCSDNQALSSRCRRGVELTCYGMLNMFRPNQCAKCGTVHAKCLCPGFQFEPCFLRLICLTLDREFIKF